MEEYCRSIIYRIPAADATSQRPEDCKGNRIVYGYGTGLERSIDGHGEGWSETGTGRWGVEWDGDRTMRGGAMKGHCRWRSISREWIGEAVEIWVIWRRRLMNGRRRLQWYTVEWSTVATVSIFLVWRSGRSRRFCREAIECTGAG